MAIKVRRGNYADLDKSKLVAGEPFTTLDRLPDGDYYVGMTIAPNNTVRLATWTNLETVLEECHEYADSAEDSKDAAAISETNAENSALDSEAWAVGQKDGSDVPSTAPQYHNNSKYYSEIAGDCSDDAEESKEDSEAWAVGTRNGQPVSPSDPQYHNSAKDWAETAEAVVGIGIATTERAGIVKPDGETIAVELDGTISTPNAYSSNDAVDSSLAIDDTDYIPVYDYSASTKKNTVWSNIKAKLKAYFDGIYSTFSGSYNDLTDKPTIPAAQVNSDWNSSSGVSAILNKPDLSVYAPLNSPAFTGTPTAPTAAAGTNTTQIATTAFVENEVVSVPVFLVRTGVTASKGEVVRIPASGNSPYLAWECNVEPVCDDIGSGIKFSDIYVWEDTNTNDGYVNITLAEAISNRTIGVKVSKVVRRT